MIATEEIIARWPGKSPVAPGGPAHPALYHMLDVAAVAERLIASFDFTPQLRDALVLLAALHDLGKIGEQFRAMLEKGARQTLGRHWEVSEALLWHHDALLKQNLGASRFERHRLYAACAGHHGRPPKEDRFDRMLNAVGEQAITDSAEAIRLFMVFWPEASLAGVEKARINALTWWLPGLVAAADWIGSNAEWFKPRRADLPLVDYLAVARECAECAVAEAGLASPAPRNGPLFDFTLRPMQTAAGEIKLPDGPALAVIEDETGAGKTEAALILAQRMMLAGKGRGIYFALPTMATADAMFSRAHNIVGKMFATSPTLTLAHGRSALSRPFRDLRGAEPDRNDEPRCTDWLADNRRRALLANIGIGTVDQALLAVLPTKFSTLRHFGLSSKILIVDEVHELGEPYMAAELATLLQAHAGAGGSAILLTATLPLQDRARLIAAFQKGAGHGKAPPDSDPAYPALTVAGGEVRRNFAQNTGARGSVAARRLLDMDAALALLVEAAGTGAACVWVRNAVDDAIAACDALRAAGVEADLLHARFALCDRKRHEHAALERFGKNGEGRADRVLVATQVVESSLDLDFDVMVSDLAPMAALIQRAGRLWRHMDLRPAGSRPVPGPVLNVLAPDPDMVSDAKWLNRVLDKGAWVYPHDVQWRTARVLFDTGEINAPSGLRALIEAVHGEDVIEPPESLQAAEIQRIGKMYAADNRAGQNLVKLEKGYREGGGAADDTLYPTRLGDEQRILMLARFEGGKLVPWSGGSDAEAEQLSQVQAARRKLDALDLPEQSSPEIAALKKDWPDWKRMALTACPVGEDGVICEGLHYDAERGLTFNPPPNSD